MAEPGAANSLTPLRFVHGEGNSLTPLRSGTANSLTPLRSGTVGRSSHQYQSTVVGQHDPSGLPPPEAQRVVQSQTKVVHPSYGEPVKEKTGLEKAAPYICEFVATFMLTFIVATSSLSPDNQWRPTVIGVAIVVIIYAVGFVSGGHLNPAVSLAFLLARKMHPCKCLCYMILQIAAGLLAAFFFELVFLTRTPRVMPVAPFAFAQAAIIELLFTTMLCFVFLNVAAATRNNPEHDKNQFFPLAVGFAVIAAGYACGNISGGLLNPAVVLALDVSGGYIGGGLLFALMELLGGALAALLFRMCRGEDYPNVSVPVDTASHVPSLAARMLSEFVGTFFVVLTFGLSVIMMSMSVAWCVGAALLSMVYALGNVSGGHFNPAVTAAVCFSGRNKCLRQEVPYYWMAQLLGGVIAGTLMRYIHYHGPTHKVEFNLGGQSEGAYHWGTVMTVEILFTFLLAYTVLAVATCDEYVVSTKSSRQNFYFAMAVGFAMFVGIFAAGPVSGGYMNPAVALAFATESVPNLGAVAAVRGWPNWTQPILQGIAVLCKYIAFFGTWMLYFVMELIGAALAAGVFRLTHPAEYREKPYSPLITYVQYPVSGAEYS